LGRVKVFISADIEGITGLVSWSQCGRPNAEHYDFGFARRMMTHDVNAAVRGARAAGANKVVIKDSHGNSKNLLIDELEAGVELVSGHGGGTDGMMQGIDATFDAALLVGYHAKAGTLGGIMEHTITGGVHRLFVNGIECGEMGLSAGVAGRFEIPVVFASSDAAGCKEMESLVPGVKTVTVKEGISRYMGKLLHPSVTGRAIENGVQDAIKNRGRMQPVKWDEPTRIRLEFNRAEEADMGAKLPNVTRIDAYTIEAERDGYVEAHRIVWNLIAMSFQGIAAQS
jgi:D-amino peptidase